MRGEEHDPRSREGDAGDPEREVIDEDAERQDEALQGGEDHRAPLVLGCASGRVVWLLGCCRTVPDDIGVRLARQSARYSPSDSEPCPGFDGTRPGHPTEDRMKIGMIVLAGGIGKRIGRPFPKQFLLLGGKPLIIHVLEKARLIADIDQVVITCPEAHLEETRADRQPRLRRALHVHRRRNLAPDRSTWGWRGSTTASR
jgi:hypothetical protein